MAKERDFEAVTGNVGLDYWSRHPGVERVELGGSADKDGKPTPVHSIWLKPEAVDEAALPDISPFMDTPEPPREPDIEISGVGYSPDGFVERLPHVQHLQVFIEAPGDTSDEGWWIVRLWVDASARKVLEPAGLGHSAR